MATTQTEVRVQWDTGNDTDSLTSGATVNSDVVSSDQTQWMASITCKADNGGTPASGDYVTVYWRGSAGDPDGTGTHEQASAGHGYFLGILDTNVDDPAIATWILPVPYQDGILQMVSNAASNSMTVSAVIVETRA